MRYKALPKNEVNYYISPPAEAELDTIREGVIRKDRDFVMVIDGEEGCLSGDTEIQLSRNKVSRRYNIKYLYNQYHNNPDKIIKKQFDLSTPAYVRSYNGKEIKLHKIKDVMYSGEKEVYLMRLANGKDIKATSNHKFLTRSGWIELGKLEINQELMCDHLKYHSNGAYQHFSQGSQIFIQIDSITKLGVEDVYDIECEDPYHNFIANGIVVHNSGKSVLAQQIARKFDPNFNIENITFNADQFIERLKRAPKFSCIILDEAFSSANSRSTLTEVNRSLVGVATEMRQQNLFVIIVIPSFFDLDKYFALWRCRCLFHVYFKKGGGRGSYIIFPKNSKKYLYLNGKKFYNYSKPKSPYPACSFRNIYTVNELEYRQKKADAFKKRVISNLAKRWKLQRDALVKEMYHNLNIRTSQFEKIYLKWGSKPIGMREIQLIVQLGEENIEVEESFDGASMDESENPRPLINITHNKKESGEGL